MTERKNNPAEGEIVITRVFDKLAQPLAQG